MTAPRQVQTVTREVAIRADGTWTSYWVRNWGYIGGGYLTEFLVCGRSIRSFFPSRKKNVKSCPTPDLRLCHDDELLERETGLRHF
jgi:hypothetical protein